MDIFTCEVCPNTYKSFKALRQHALQKHPDESESVVLHGEKKYKCGECYKQFNNKQAFSRHERNEHNVKYVKLNQLYKCSFCVYKHYQKCSILSHLSSSHNTNVASETKTFQNEHDFLEWKSTEEKNNKCKFIATGGKHKDQNVRSQMLICHRSQYYKPKLNSQRSIKLQGSCKIQAFCPAEIKYKEVNGIYSVTYVKNHTHTLELEHITLTSEERETIATKIANGISFERIMDDIRDSFHKGEALECIHLVTRKDLLNIEKSFNLRGHYQRHKNNALSIESWIKEESNNPTPSVLYYKPQSQKCADFPELNDQDFVLILMNKAQGEILQKYGKKTICIDGTHGLNQYNFQLITLLVIDDFHQGFPCTFLISNRTDSTISKILFLKIKERIGDLLVENFMSDMDESFFNGFRTVMPMPKRHLYCSWHVDRAWRKNLTRINSKEKQAHVYKILRTLLEETDEKTFSALLAEAISFLLRDEATKDFGKYFKQNYTNNVMSWGFCYRVYSGINTNMHLERMHRTIKEIYCQKKKIKRLDHMLLLLQKFVRDRLFDQLITYHKGKLTSKIKDLRKRHTASLELDNTIITEYDGGWICPSSNQTETYFIQRNKEECECHLRCHICNHCVHNFLCTCIDNTIQWNMCKHIHLLCRSRILLINSDVCKQNDSSIENNNNNDNMMENVIVTQVTKERLNMNENIHEVRKNMLQYFKEMVDDADMDQLQLIRSEMKKLKSTVGIVKRRDALFLKNHNGHEEEKLKNEPSNKQMDAQRRLFSTKKKSQKKTEIIVKPSAEEKVNISLNMLYH